MADTDDPCLRECNVHGDSNVLLLAPALARLLQHFRHCIGRDKTFTYLEKYILGLLSDVKRKSIEPIALASRVAVRTLQEFLAFFRCDEDRGATS